MEQAETIVFRQMRAGDIAAVQAIEAECFTNPWSIQAFADEMKNPQAVTFVAESDGRICAFINARIVLDEVYINNIAVTMAWRGRGIGFALLGEFERALPEFVTFITLEVRAGNMPAQGLYRKSGYTQVGIRREFYTEPPEDAFLMTKYMEKNKEGERS